MALIEPFVIWRIRFDICNIFISALEVFKFYVNFFLHVI